MSWLPDLMSWKDLGVLSAGIVTLLGSLMTVFSAMTATPRRRAGLGVLFVAFAALGFVADKYVRKADEQEKNDEIRNLTGGDNFVYLVAAIPRGATKGPFKPITRGTGEVLNAVWFVSPAEANGDDKDSRYRSVDRPRDPVPVLYPDANAPGPLLNVGQWRIEWRIKGEPYRQSLSIFECNGRLVQRAAIIRKEIEVYSTPMPPDCLLRVK